MAGHGESPSKAHLKLAGNLPIAELYDATSSLRQPRVPEGGDFVARRAREMDEIIKEFVQESTENLDRLDRELVLLEKDASSKELLASVFRTIHTIKGTAGFLGFSRLQSVTHAGESLLSRLRDGELLLNGDITSGLLNMVDAVRRMLAI